MKLRIATFNLENLDDVESSSPSLQERIEVLRPQIKRLDADIICFQEINGQEAETRPRKLLVLKNFWKIQIIPHLISHPHLQVVKKYMIEGI